MSAAAWISFWNAVVTDGDVSLNRLPSASIVDALSAITFPVVSRAWESTSIEDNPVWSVVHALSTSPRVSRRTEHDDPVARMPVFEWMVCDSLMFGKSDTDEEATRASLLFREIVWTLATAKRCFIAPRAVASAVIDMYSGPPGTCVGPWKDVIVEMFRLFARELPFEECAPWVAEMTVAVPADGFWRTDRDHFRSALSEMVSELGWNRSPLYRSYVSNARRKLISVGDVARLEEAPYSETRPRRVAGVVIAQTLASAFEISRDDPMLSVFERARILLDTMDRLGDDGSYVLDPLVALLLQGRVLRSRNLEVDILVRDTAAFFQAVSEASSIPGVLPTHGCYRHKGERRPRGACHAGLFKCQMDTMTDCHTWMFWMFRLGRKQWYFDERDEWFSLDRTLNLYWDSPMSTPEWGQIRIWMLRLLQLLQGRTGPESPRRHIASLWHTARRQAIMGDAITAECILRNGIPNWWIPGDIIERHREPPLGNTELFEALGRERASAQATDAHG